MKQPTVAGAPWLELTGARKSFGTVAALVNGQLSLWPGEVHALLGENGAGKSTLVKILAGVHAHDAGELRVGGRVQRFRGPSDARDAGIAVIYQEPTLFGDLTVAENIYMGRQPLRRWCRIDHARIRADVVRLLDAMGVRLDPDRAVRGLSIADQQVVEIAKALSQEAKVLIMDEPTAALSSREVERLFSVIERLRAQGVAILFITHRLEEVFALTQRVTIMRDGALVHRAMTAELDTRSIVRWMVGRSEIARALFGIDPVDRGEVQVAGRPLVLGDSGRAIAQGMAMVPEDRRIQGLVMDLSIARNASLTVLERLARFGLVSAAAERRLADTWGRRLQLKAHDLDARVGTLSGGNQQKVVIGKWLATRPRVLIIDEPTRGIDVGAKAEVYRTLAGLLEQGLGVLMISSELPEILGMADRVVVIHEGRVTAQLAHAQMSEERIMAAALGQPAAEAA
jgi:rhamnose transport system ATP-binding protein